MQWLVEVSTERMLKELIEVHHPDVPLQARLEVVITEDSSSFLAAFNHKSIIRILVMNRLLVSGSEHVKARGMQREYVYIHTPNPDSCTIDPMQPVSWLRQKPAT